MQKKSILIILVFILLINISTVSCISPTAPIVYVDTNGNGDYNCDGIDDHIQINQALDYVANNVGFTTVHLNGPNTYWISSTILMSGNTILEGDSDAVIKLIDEAGWDSYIPMIRNKIDGSNNFTIRGFKIDGNSESQSVSRGLGYYNMIFFKNCYNVRVTDMRLEWGCGDGLKVLFTGAHVGNKAFITFTNNSIYKLGHDALYVLRLNNVTAAHNDVFTRTNSAIRLTDSGNSTVYNNTIQSSYSIDGSTGPGIELDSNTGYTVDNIEIYNNTIHTLSGSGIWLTNEDTDDIIRTSNIHIHHNTFYDVGQRVVDSGRTMAAITVGQFDDVLIENNVIDDGGRAGIKAFVDPVEYTMDASFTITARNNIIVNTDGIPGAGIWNYNDITHTVISENNCYYNNADGAYSGTNIITTNDIHVDPLFADPSNHDYHVKSTTGRWSDNGWIIDDATSPLIDAGHPTSDYSNESEPNGDRINIGRYGNTAEASRSVSGPPTASAGPDQTVTAGDTVTLDGSASTDDIGDIGITSYVWDFDNLNGLQQDATGALVQHTYNTAGTYIVTLTVTDTDGNTDKDSVIITVTEVDHEPIVNEKLDIEYGTVTIDGDLSDWDDSAGIIIQEPIGRDMEERNTAVVKGQYDDTYMYMSFDVTDSNLLATALDENGSIFYDDSVEIFIDTLNNNGVAMETDDYHFMINLNGAVRDYIGTGSGKDINYTGNILKGISLMGSNGDASDTDTGYIIEIAIPWDDISGLPTGDIVGLDLTINDRDSDNVDEVQHYDWCNLIWYAIPDEWNDGVLKSSSVSDQPTASAGSDQTVTSGDTVTLDGSASTDDVGIESYVWDFDDSNGLQQDATGAAVQHTYNTAGTYIVTLTVTDTDGNTDKDSVIITVTEVDHEPIVNEKLDIEYGTVTIDGDLSDWDDSAGIIIQEPTGRDMEERNTAVVKGQYDDTYLYMSFDVTDSNLLATALDENGNIFYDDSVEIFIDTLNNNGVAMETDDYHFMINLNGAVRDYIGTGSGKDINYTGNILKGISLMGSNGDASDTDTGYIIEIAIPWDDISGLPTGDIVGLDLTINDKDSDNVDEVQHYDWCNLTWYAIPDEWNDGVLKSSSVSDQPTASAGSDQTVTAGDTVTLDGSASTDDVGIESYVWDFDDSNGLQQDATGVAVQHTYNTAGTYTATLTVTDTDGNTYNDAVIIINAPVLSSIMNPGFESGTTPWEFYTNGAGTFSMASPGYEGNNAARLALSSGSSNIQLYQAGINLEPDTRYRLSFAAYSTTGHDVTVRLLKHVSPYTAYSPDFTANLGTNWQTFTTEFTTSGFTSTVNDGRLQFWLAPFAESGDNYYIDNVRLDLC